MSANHLTTEQAREHLADAFLAKQSYEDLKIGATTGIVEKVENFVRLHFIR